MIDVDQPQPPAEPQPVPAVATKAKKSAPKRSPKASSKKPAKKKPKKVAKPVPKKPVAKSTPKPKPKASMPANPLFNKSAFIREHASLAPKEIVALAEKQGQTLSKNMVYTIRSEAKKRGAKAPKAAPKPLKASSANLDALGVLGPAIRELVQQEVHAALRSVLTAITQPLSALMIELDS